MLHLWQPKEEILKAVVEIRGTLLATEHRRLTPSERLTLLAELEKIRSWTSDLPDQFSLWESIKSLF